MLPGYVRSIRRVERLLTPKRYRYMGNANLAVGLFKRRGRSLRTELVVGPERVHCLWLILLVEDKGSSA